MTATATRLVVIVHGNPVPQGSKRLGRRGPRHIILDDNDKKLTPWRAKVKAAATDYQDGRPPLDGPLSAEVTFTLPRPATHYRTGRFATLLRDLAPAWPASRAKVGGDIDKLARAVLDALTDARVWNDDSQVVELTARKVYVDTGLDALDRPGAVIRVWTMT